MISLCWWVVHVQASKDDSVSAAAKVLCCNILMSRRAGTLQFLAAMSWVRAETGRTLLSLTILSSSSLQFHQPGAQRAVLQEGWQGSRVHLVKIHQVLQAGKLGLGPVQRKSIFARVRNLRGKWQSVIQYPRGPRQRQQFDSVVAE